MEIKEVCYGPWRRNGEGESGCIKGASALCGRLKACCCLVEGRGSHFEMSGVNILLFGDT